VWRCASLTCRKTHSTSDGLLPSKIAVDMIGASLSINGWPLRIDSSSRYRAMEIRQAQLTDASEACRVLRSSIAELCRADHENDPALLRRWLSNKTPDNVRLWIQHPQSHVFVAVENNEIIGVGAVTAAGEVTLNYVAPPARFRGVSKALLKHLELKVTELGKTTCVLTSTKTAHRFYLSAGYVDQASDDTGYRMSKHLFPTA